MKLKINKVLSYIFCICLVFTTIVSVIDYCCFDKNFYAKEYEKLETAKDIKVSDEDLGAITDCLLDYLRDDRDDLVINAYVDEEYREVFVDREKIHMIDVKNLYLNAIEIRNITFLIMIISFILLICLKGISFIKNAYKETLLLFVAIVGFIGIFCLIDFNAFWTNFHKVFFPQNDYWLLDPRHSILINIVPSTFFYDLVIKIVIIVLVLFAIYYALFSIRKRVDRND